MIKPIAIQAHQLESVKIVSDQLIYCLDTKEAYYDLSDTNRIQVGCTIQLDSEFDKITLQNIQSNRIYIVKETNKLYRYLNAQYVNVTERAAVIDLIVPIEIMEPTVLNKQGINYAPKTLASVVYTNDGNNVEEILKNMVNDNRRILLYTRTEHVVATIDGQRIFGIPFPIPNYDLAKFPMLIIHKEKILATNDYAISNDQVIISDKLDGLAKDEILTFVFHYNVVLTNDSLNAESINNVRFFVGDKEPYPKYETDVWFDTKKLEVKQYTNTKWKVIVKSNMDDNYPFHISKGTVVLTESSSVIDLGISDFNVIRDNLMIYENSVYLEEREDYSISADGRFLTNINDGIWVGTPEEPTVFNYIIFKGTNSTSESQIVKKTSIINNVTSEVGITNFNKYTDSILVYENSIYLEEGEDYRISADSSKIIKVNDSWDGFTEPIYLNFIIFKNSVKRPEIEEEETYSLKSIENPTIDTELKGTILNALGLTESQFNKLKEIL